ncbi:hypothetical protein LXJ59_26640, partial [Escherichia coli]|nr:hypothetical protein [Escherichia coli]
PTLTIVPECRRGGMESLTDRDPQPAPRVHDAIAGFVQADRSIKDRQRCFSCHANGDDAPAPEFDMAAVQGFTADRAVRRGRQ